MRPRTVLALALVVVTLGSLVVLGATSVLNPSGTLTEQWVSDTGRSVQSNHHAPAAGRIHGQPWVYAPVSGPTDPEGCALVALSGSDGQTRWTHEIPEEGCEIHSVADPALADYDGDGTREVIAATTEQAVIAFDPLTGDEELRYELGSYGYTQPVVADVTGDGASEIVVVDIKGTVAVIRPDGTALWTTNLSTYVWGQPAVADFDGDGEGAEIALSLSNGEIRLYEADGTEQWTKQPFDGSITWMTTGQADDDPQHEMVVATTAGVVGMVDGADGTIEWEHSFGRLAAVHAFGDGDRDGDSEVYATAKDGKLRSMDAATGDIEWETTLTTESVQMMPPPKLGDVDGDGEDELVAVSNDGIVSVVDPVSGDVLGSSQRDVQIFTHPALADTDGDGKAEIYVMYGDGRVFAFDYDER